MKTQLQNQGELKELKVMIEKETAEAFDRMSKVSGIPLADLVVIALKRYRSAHSDWDIKPSKSE